MLAETVLLSSTQKAPSHNIRNISVYIPKEAYMDLNFQKYDFACRDLRRAADCDKRFAIPTLKAAAAGAATCSTTGMNK